MRSLRPDHASAQRARSVYVSTVRYENETGETLCAWSDNTGNIEKEYDAAGRLTLLRNELDRGR